MAKIYTSDLHWFHCNICKFTDRPWTADENTEKLIELWNNNVAVGDEIWHLGDFAFVRDNAKGYADVNKVLDRLNGQKRLILGNHDPSSLYYRLQKERNDIVSVDRLKESFIGRKEDGNKTKIVMCHYPLVTFNQSYRGSIQLHGHEHGRIHNKGKSIDVGLDGSFERLGEHRFWTEQDILEYASKLEIYNPSGRL